jgi:hypothetical protein
LSRGFLKFFWGRGGNFPVSLGTIIVYQNLRGFAIVKSYKRKRNLEKFLSNVYKLRLEAGSFSKSWGKTD